MGFISAITQPMHQCLSYVLNHIPAMRDSEPDHDFDYMCNMYEKLKNSKEREWLYTNPTAYKLLLALIDDAKKYNNKTYELMFKEYLWELEDRLDAPRKRINQLLQKMIEADCPKPRECPPFSNFPPVAPVSQKDCTAPPQEKENSCEVQDKEIYWELPFFYYLSENELDEFCRNFESLSLEGKESESEQASKRCKISDEPSNNISPLNIMEPMLAPMIWKAQYEARRYFSAADNFEAGHENQKKKRNIQSLF